MKCLRFILLVHIFLLGSMSAYSQPRCCWTPDSMPVKSTLRDSISKRINRFEKEILKFEALDDSLGFEENSVLFIGSSSIRIWKSLVKDMDPIPVINRGFGGSTLMELSHYANRIVYKYKPIAIVVYCGENDLAVDYSRVEDVLEEFQKLDTLRRTFLPGIKIFYISIKPSPSRAFYWEKFQLANELIKQYIYDNKNDMFYIDITQQMLDSKGDADRSIFLRDMLHMNSTGYEKWTKVIKPVLVDKLGINVK